MSKYSSWDLADSSYITPQRLDQVFNEDVEMHAPLSDCLAFVVLDTNILIHHFDTITRFVEKAENQPLPVIVVIPGVVIYELDGQKNRQGLFRLARRATAWILGKVRERKLVKGQTHRETCKGSRDWRISDPGENFGPERTNDQLILDCCMYFQTFRPTLLCSADKNLCIESERTGISTISPTDTWNSEELIEVVFGGSAKDEQMMVDDDASAVETYEPSHELDKLHLRVIDYFTRSLIDLVGSVGGEEILGQTDEGTSASRYAPQWQRKGQHYSQWTASDALEYLDSKKKIPVTSPRIETFLSKPHTTQGARRGQDWSRRDWDVVLGGLGRIGDDWDVFSKRSLADLDRHVEEIFARKMRPTGI